MQATSTLRRSHEPSAEPVSKARAATEDVCSELRVGLSPRPLCWTMPRAEWLEYEEDGELDNEAEADEPGSEFELPGAGAVAGTGASAREDAADVELFRARRDCLLRRQSCMCVRFSSDGRQLLALRRRLPPVLFDAAAPVPLAQFDHAGYLNSCTMKSACFAGLRDQVQ